jgi:subtilisin-like proprotein convertase family protein
MKQLYFLFSLLMLSSFAFGQSATYSNSNAITIVDNTTASVYSSNIAVSGFTGTVNNVAVIIKNFSHGAPSDVAICLESPSGQKLLIQEAMWGAPATDITFMLSDLGASQVGVWDLPSNGTYKPTANNALVNFNTPGPGATYNNPGPGASGSATMATTFANATANGTWRLWIVDVSGGDAGTINGGWDLVINPNTVLPVDLAGFETSCESNDILNVNWTTHNEENSKDFTIQISPDGSFFEDAKTVKASGNSQIEMTYKASIARPYAKTFVRLKLTDLNNQSTYSEVLDANCGSNLPIAVSPNPMVDQFIIDNPSGEYMQYVLTNLEGKIVLEGNAKSVHHLVTLSSEMVSGVYILKVKSAKAENVFKLRKQ